MANMSLVRVGGVCAILAVVSGIMGRIFFGSGDLVAGHWFDSLYALLGIPVVWGFYHALHGEGAVLRIAATAFVTGIIFSIFHGFVQLGISYELVPDTLGPTGWLAAGVGGGLISLVGVPLFSFVILRTSVVPKWVGWLGLINVAAQLALGMVLWGAFDGIRPPWLVAAGTQMGFVLAMGVVMLRLKEPVAPDSVGVSS